MIYTFDDFIPEPERYREGALKLEYQSFEFPECTFHGIALAPHSLFPAKVKALFPHLIPTLTFFRKSPLGQQEPNFIHTDIDMGRWTAILYLNENPPLGDGTCFWRHVATDAIGSYVPHEMSREGDTEDGWELYKTVYAKFNRLLVFPSHLFHSRAIHENWGHGESARLTQVLFSMTEPTSIVEDI